MRCSRVQYLYDEYTSGAMDLTTAGKVDEHLAECLICRDFFESNSELGKFIREGSEVAHPGEPYWENLSGRVLPNILAGGASDEGSGQLRTVGTTRREFWNRPIWWASGLAATVAVAFVLSPSVLSKNRPRQGTSVARSVAANRAEPALTIRSTNPVPVRPDQREVRLVASTAPNTAMPGPKSPGRGVTVIDKSIGTAQPQNVRRRTTWASAVPSPLAELEAVFATPQALETLYIALEELAEEVARNSLNPQAHDQYLQWVLYNRAQNDVSTGLLDEARKAFYLVLDIDLKTRLGQLACMRLADIYYYELADFEQAQEYYALCQEESPELLLSPEDAIRVESLCELLKQHTGSQWSPLVGLRTVHGGTWREALNVVDYYIASDPMNDRLLADAARILCERLRKDEQVSPEIIAKVKELNRKIDDSPLRSESRAWMCLTEGDMIWGRGEDLDSAVQAYQGAVKAAGRSYTAVLARERLSAIRRQARIPAN